MIPSNSPFHPENEPAYDAWRAEKLARYPQRVDDLVVEVRDPRSLTQAEHAAIVDRCRVANMAIYAGPGNDAADKVII